MKENVSGFTACVTGILVSCAGFAAAAAASELFEPDWKDPYFAHYLEKIREGVPVSGGIDFSLPVLGFSTVGAPGAVEVAEAPLGDRLDRTVPAWPACAKQTPEVVTVPNQSDQAAGLPLGTWYTSTYDFGCVEVVVEGDRNTPDIALVPQRDAPSENGEIEITNQDENAGMAVDEEGHVVQVPEDPDTVLGPAVASYARGNLTYTITVACSAQSQALCASHGDVRALVEQLVPLAGRPQP